MSSLLVRPSRGMPLGKPDNDSRFCAELNSELREVIRWVGGTLGWDGGLGWWGKGWVGLVG